MPIYEYQCQACHHNLEKLQKLSDDPLTDCPHCHEPALRKKISAAGFRLSGSGWYETDFKKGGSKKNLTNNDAKSTEGASESKADSKKTVEPSGGEKSSKAETTPAKSSASKE